MKLFKFLIRDRRLAVVIAETEDQARAMIRTRCAAHEFVYWLDDPDVETYVLDFNAPALVAFVL